MNEMKNIDRLFQEKFKDFEVAPSEQVWDNIESALKEKKRRRVIPLWFRLSGIAAALLIGMMVVNLFYFDGDKNTKDSIVWDKNNKPVKPANESVGKMNAVSGKTEDTSFINGNPIVTGENLDSKKSKSDPKNPLSGKNTQEKMRF